ncbi:MAG: alanine racemase [Nostocales cyanobacterium LE14-WE4]|jgi:alanine racemase|uniref:Alanine racemase n=1 Tax=Dolichospermum flos-aquae CCAP 1403/13F TaxID=315271 RepID=A0A6H2C1H9_DOLFA|nr:MULTISPECIES: alanine racemase [Nostocales]MBJ7295054.1 alanine racemase [Dolichospermum sp.]MBO1047207.1 alanine racemase [Dolichospermum sp. DEX182a]MBS9384208.1 alanine racemase [Dolichospermum sp. BR01]MBS9388533.1 alanine racemase [Dolichospermum sp. WA123]MCE2701179.1 alanine racemase [Anabaena sp. 49633_E8]MDJ0500300.1 alanine racemase [Nostocales cyanobacterium LE14-WE4]OBQ03737.1 MAG: alanine racemase [Anabaena sp. LE011-02]OBQ41154.1 MAG: alanine racemase [Anabaena sp. MDT14b]
MLSRKQTPIFADNQECDTYAWFSQRAWVEIDLGALSDNVKQLVKFLSPRTQLMAVVKADAYGHGAVAVAKTALEAGAGWLGVATVPEGIQLREDGIKAPILILGATNTPEQIQAIAHWQLQPTLCSPKQALEFSNTLETINYNSSLSVHIKLDTGMSRLGTNWQQAAEFVQLVQGLPHLDIASIYSHLATADSPDATVMMEQHSRFEEAIAHIKAKGITIPSLHLANSAATLADSRLHYDMVRVGLAIYGLYPANHLQNHIKLQPVLQLKARVTQVKTIAAGTGVSYGHHFIAPQEMRLAVVGIGYADGVPRHLSNQMQVLIRGQRVPQIGAITMDQIMLDVSSIPDLQEGEIVTLLGEQGKEQISADDWANCLNTISWEILCGFKHRLPRVAVM